MESLCMCFTRKMTILTMNSFYRVCVCVLCSLHVYDVYIRVFLFMFAVSLHTPIFIWMLVHVQHTTNVCKWIYANANANANVCMYLVIYRSIAPHLWYVDMKCEMNTVMKHGKCLSIYAFSSFALVFRFQFIIFAIEMGNPAISSRLH